MCYNTHRKIKNGAKRMSRFDEYVEQREEERNRERYASLNAALEKSLRTRSREEVVSQLFCDLSIPLSVASLPLGVGSYAKERKGANALVF